MFCVLGMMAGPLISGMCCLCSLTMWIFREEEEEMSSVPFLKSLMNKTSRSPYRQSKSFLGPSDLL